MANTPSTMAQVLSLPHTDQEALQEFFELMQARMGQAATDGRSGWDNPLQCSRIKLLALLHKAVDDKDWVSVANYAMMIQHRDVTHGQ